MALDEKFHKTGGSYVHFHCLGTFCDLINVIRSAALTGNFFKDQKGANIKLFFKSIFSMNPRKILLKTENGKCYFILCLICAF